MDNLLNGVASGVEWVYSNCFVLDREGYRLKKSLTKLAITLKFTSKNKSLIYAISLLPRKFAVF